MCEHQWDLLATFKIEIIVNVARIAQSEIEVKKLDSEAISGRNKALETPFKPSEQIGVPLCKKD